MPTTVSAGAGMRGPAARWPTMIEWLDTITGGGLPRHHMTMITGGAGTGKTILSCQIAAFSGRSAIIVAFEEHPDDIVRNVAAFDWAFSPRIGTDIHFIDARPGVDAVITGTFDLTGLLAAVSAKARATGADLVVFDGLDQLLQWIEAPTLQARELSRIAAWLRSERLTGIVTAKADPSGEPIAALETLQFAVSTVVTLERRFEAGGSVRTLRILKNRGSPHGSVSYPYFIAERGMEPIEWRMSTTEGAEPGDSREGSGMQRLDALLGGGYYRGSTILLSGVPGTGKSTLGTLFADGICRRGGRALHVAFDESPEHMVRNVRSVGVDLAAHVEAGRLRMIGLSAGAIGPEQSFAAIMHAVEDHRPDGIVIDPISALFRRGPADLGNAIIRRLVAEAKGRNMTAILTSLVQGAGYEMSLDTLSGVSTIADAWIVLAYAERGGERNRTLSIVKARGSAHSNQTRELVMSSDGCSLADVYTTGGEVLLGTARLEREAQDAEDERRRMRDHEARRRELTGVIGASDERARLLALEVEAARAELAALEDAEDARQSERTGRRRRIGARRFADQGGQEDSESGGGDGHLDA